MVLFGSILDIVFITLFYQLLYDEDILMNFTKRILHECLDYNFTSLELNHLTFYIHDSMNDLVEFKRILDVFGLGIDDCD